MKNRSKIDEKLMKNRREIALGQFWAFKAVSGTHRDALGTTLGRLKIAPRRSWDAPDAPRRAKTCPKACPGPPRDAIQSAPGVILSPRLVERVFATLFRGFDAAKTTVFLMVSPYKHDFTARGLVVRKNVENPRISTPKMTPGSVRDAENRARAAMFER